MISFFIHFISHCALHAVIDCTLHVIVDFNHDQHLNYIPLSL